MARTANLSIFRGEDSTINFTAYTTDTGSTPQDITGWTLVFTVSEAPNSATKLIQKTCSHLVDASGTFKATITPTDTNIQPGIYAWDVYRTDSDNVRCLGSGFFKIRSVSYKP